MNNLFLDKERSDRILYLASIPAAERKLLVINKEEIKVPPNYDFSKLAGLYVHLTHFAQNGKLTWEYCPTLTCSCNVGYVDIKDNKPHIRKLSVQECEELQTLPIDYTKLDSQISDSERKKMIGNGWTVDVIAKILQKLEIDRPINVLSLFDGISCGKLALERAGIKINNYFSSEIDSKAKLISDKNHQGIHHLGDVTKISYSNGILETDTESIEVKIDLVIGGSPCQSLSCAGQQTGFDGKSGLYWEYSRILKEICPKHFLLENVLMKKEWEDIITKNLGIKPKLINSRTVSNQNRKRLYWTNIF